ncbi:hypothetical protein AEQU3_02516 [Aequorivita antarctica]|nr:hypothetical protein AEQU3_02516 [Aequorivita antarctica]
MILFILFVFVPFVVFICGQVLIRLEATDKEKKIGKIIISIVYAIIGLGYCGILIN